MRARRWEGGESLYLVSGALQRTPLDEEPLGRAAAPSSVSLRRSSHMRRTLCTGPLACSPISRTSVNLVRSISTSTPNFHSPRVSRAL